jgi:Ca2+-binding EF-hand superfamily protein
MLQDMLTNFRIEKKGAKYFSNGSPHDHRAKVNFLFFIAGVTVYARTNWFYKIKFLHALFDFDDSGSITIDELVILASSIVSAIGIFTETEMPNLIQLRPVVESIFTEADVRPDKMITLEEAFNWVKNDPAALSIFTSNEPN